MKLKFQFYPEGLCVFDYDSLQVLRLNRKETLNALGVKDFSLDAPPETVHLEISNKCNLNCDYCYVKKEGKELTTREWKRIIQELADSGVWQITFGGGEPTLREDLKELAEFAKSKKLVLCMTTNGEGIYSYYKDTVSDDTLKLFDQINISWHEQNSFEPALLRLKDLGIRRGINYVYNTKYKSDLAFIKNISLSYDAEILFLTYKPVCGDGDKQIPPEEVYATALVCHKEGYKVAMDGLTCQICLAGKRFADVDSMGNLMVCSFIREPIGNLLNNLFDSIWKLRKRDIKCPYLKE